MVRTRVLLTVMAMTVSFSACGGDDGDSAVDGIGSAPSERPDTQTPEPTAQEEPPATVATSVEPRIELTVDGATFEDFEIQTCTQFLDDDPLEVVAFFGDGDSSWSIASTTSTQPGGAPRVIAITAGNSGDPSQLPSFFDQQGQASVKQEFIALASEFSLTTVDDIATLEGLEITFTDGGDPAVDAMTFSGDLTIVC